MINKLCIAVEEYNVISKDYKLDWNEVLEVIEDVNNIEAITVALNTIQARTHYLYSYEIASLFYQDCLKFWKGNETEALKDVSRITTNPFSPHGKELDRQAVIDFVNKNI